MSQRLAELYNFHHDKEAEDKGASSISTSIFILACAIETAAQVIAESIDSGARCIGLEISSIAERDGEF